MSEPLRILTTEVQPWRLLKDRAEADLGFPLEFIEKDFINTQRTAALDPGSYDVYDQCFHNLDIVWHWRAIQAIDTRRIRQWDAMDDLTRTAPGYGPRGRGDVPASRLFVQHDATLSHSPTGRISMLPTYYNFDSFAVSAPGVDVDRDVTSWAELLNPRWAGHVALVDEPAIGVFDFAMALAADGRMSFRDMGNMSVAEIDTMADHAASLIQSGHFQPFWRRADDPVDRFRKGELMLAPLWGPTIVSMKRHGMKVRQARPAEGYRAWHGGMCLSRQLSGARLERAYEWLNWYLDGYAGAMVARQGYYMSVPERVKAHMPKADWDYWYEGLPAAETLNDAAGRPIIPEGESRSGGSYRDRSRHIGIWNSTMDEHNYLVRRWNEVIALAATKGRGQRRAS
ncbi:extracellular solute-binding protein [Pseudooceanicola sp. CBS1P-1]|uniref:Extracellular solute-binding protein n=1 Tax=Pseudooceanicola albus TaxID=2692189 RepID=A0A6L7G5S9_9RHOB|nr:MULTISPECIES: extracellular solute-binding protein [Pseudooceanicola]MBT9386107.1 extracellular solute-binding protein [Pseudooceanicola endophyticus]MXN19475.1 extracellular solute-binding protein [Pseudooceanicola albus]